VICNFDIIIDKVNPLSTAYYVSKLREIHYYALLAFLVASFSLCD